MSKREKAYHKVPNWTADEEKSLALEARNYGRLSRAKMDGLADQDLDLGADWRELLRRERPWRLQRALQSLVTSKSATYGTAAFQGYQVGVVDGGMERVLGKGDSDALWDDFALWRTLLGSALVNLLPDRPFSLFVFAKDEYGDDFLVFYMELGINGTKDRHVMLWEMDQVLTEVRGTARPHEASRSAEYASAYQKIYFFINWSEDAPRRVVRAVVSDLPKTRKKRWDEWLGVCHKQNWFDAVVSIALILSSAWASIAFGQPVISLLAGIVVAGIGSEEWVPPQAVIFGAMSRFYANESLTLRVMYETDLSISIKSVLITLLASSAELSGLASSNSAGDDGASCLLTTPDCNATLKLPGNGDCPLVGQPSLVSYCSCCALSASDSVILIGSLINILLLLPTAFSGVYGGFSHSDFPAATSYFPKVYLTKHSFLRQIVADCRPVEEFCSVYRPLLHWQRGVKNRFLGDYVDLAAPGAPPGWLCFFMASPASALMSQGYAVFGARFQWWLLPLGAVEQLLALLGAFLVLLLDFVVVLGLAVVLVLKSLRLVPRPVVRQLVAMCMLGYAPAQGFLHLVDAYNAVVAAWLDLAVMNCRGRSTARLYRLPLMQEVRTGKASNHAFKFGDAAADTYYRCSDMVVVNPRTPKLGMLGAGKLMAFRHKLLWTTYGGVRYASPVLSCGDNTVSRRNSIVDKLRTERNMEELRAIDSAAVEPEDSDTDGSDDDDHVVDMRGDKDQHALFVPGSL